MNPYYSKTETKTPPKFEVIGITGVPEIQPGDQLGKLIIEASENQETPLENGDILVIAQKIVSKSEGRLVELNKVLPSDFAKQLASDCQRDPRLIELVLRESRAIVRMDPARGILITETNHGLVCANSGIDTSNIQGHEVVSLLPKNPDSSALRIRQEIECNINDSSVAIIISDTFGRAWREGHVNMAIGVSGINTIKDYRGTQDSTGKKVRVTRVAVVDELASTAELVMQKADGVPAVIIRGYTYSKSADGIKQLIRDRSTDLFR